MSLAATTDDIADIVVTPPIVRCIHTAKYEFVWKLFSRSDANASLSEPSTPDSEVTKIYRFPEGVHDILLQGIPHWTHVTVDINIDCGDYVDKYQQEIYTGVGSESAIRVPR